VTWSARKLNDRVVESLFDYNVPVFPLQTSSIVSINNDKALKLNTVIIKSVIDSGLIPILHGDILPHPSSPLILSGEKIIQLLVDEFQVEKIIMCTNTDGVFIDPQKPERGVINCIDESNYKLFSSSFRSSSAIDVTGGMKEKVDCLYEIAQKCKVPSQIINGTNPMILRDSLNNKDVVCTWIRGN
jgi:isopentenyl phosphate kinase